MNNDAQKSDRLKISVEIANRLKPPNATHAARPLRKFTFWGNLPDSELGSRARRR
jgi:hypothetical protein